MTSFNPSERTARRDGLQNDRQRLALGVAAGVVIISVITLAVFYQLLRPPIRDLVALAIFLSITAVVAFAAGYGAYRLGLIYRSPSLTWALLGGYVLSNGLAFIGVWVTARLMFVSQHDLVLASVLLIFAGGIAASLGYFLSVSITDRIVSLNRAAEALAAGELGARVAAPGRDEVGDLARNFNYMADQLDAAAQRQRELDRMRRDLVAWIGHDLRTPLSSMRAIVEALADGLVDDPATERRYLETVQNDIASLSQLIDDLFDMARIDAGGLVLDLAASSLSDLISDTLEAFSVQATRQKVTLEGRVAPGLDPLTMDARQIGRVLSNLVDNALRHTPAGGVVRIEALACDGVTCVEVQDTGEGIATDDLPHVFEQFFRGERSRSRATGGAGLGLAIARGIVEAHGGEISVESRPTNGTTFRFTLPGVRR